MTAGRNLVQCIHLHFLSWQIFKNIKNIKPPLRSEICKILMRHCMLLLCKRSLLYSVWMSDAWDLQECTSVMSTGIRLQTLPPVTFHIQRYSRKDPCVRLTVFSMSHWWSFCDAWLACVSSVIAFTMPVECVYVTESYLWVTRLINWKRLWFSCSYSSLWTENTCNSCDEIKYGLFLRKKNVRYLILDLTCGTA